jgi:uncharacterized membrane protein
MARDEEAVVARRVQGSGSDAQPDVESPSGFERLVFFSDAVFAIVITLLVLPLTEEVRAPAPDGLAQHFLELWPSILSFVVSFLVIGQFWISHHHVFGLLRGYDHVLMWLNIATLLTVCFLPVPTALLGSQPTSDDKFPVVLYACSMAASSVLMTATWLYAAGRGLLRPTVSEAERRVVTARSLVTSAAFLVSIPAAFVGLAAAMACWLVLLPAARIVAGRRRPPN